MAEYLITGSVALYRMPLGLESRMSLFPRRPPPLPPPLLEAWKGETSVFLVKMKIDFPLSFSSFPPQKNPCLKLLLIFYEYI